MDALLELVQKNARLTTEEMAAMLDMPVEEVGQKLNAFEKDGIILGYQAVINEEKLDLDLVRAVIEIRITPERDGGFNRLAERIARYSEVRSCYLMSGGYDLLVIVEGRSLREVASLVSEKLATMQGVLSTSTHFLLKPYKENGILMHQQDSHERLPVTP